ncbi:MAG: Ig-like domain-containing protein [Gemmatimonadetes bacterium]|nr:Ig-like domain-containing protein [Gemmatimonadota bacterium]
MLGFLLLAAFQQGQTPAPAQGLPPSPIAKIEITPAAPSMTARDTMRLRARALDAAGREVPNVTVRFVLASGARFEGRVTTDGLVSSGATGRLPISVIASVPGTAPVTERIEVPMLPGAPARVVIDKAPNRLAIGQRVGLTATAFSKDNDPRAGDRMRWTSLNPAVARVNEAGVVTAVGPGKAVIRAGTALSRDAGNNSVNSWIATAEFPIEVVRAPIGSISVTPGTVDAKTGDVLHFGVDVRSTGGASIAGLTPTWSMSPGQGTITTDGAFVGYEAGTYTIVANLGERSAVATVRLTPRDVRRQAEVVGRLPRTLFTTEEVWLHPNGKNLYLGTGGGGDRMYAIDVSAPGAPVVTDSLVSNTRRVNDIMTTPDGKFMVHTREGASDRKNGIVIASLEDPAHPKVIAEFTEGVTAGVHSAFIFQQPKYGTHVYITNDGTGALHVIDINDPYHPKQVAEYRFPGPMAGNSLHDLDIQDGLAYLSNWNNGLVILDVGNGMKGGSPTKPVLVSQYKYDLNAMYRDVEASGGPGYIRGTHTAWRHKNYVFIADEVFPASQVAGAKDASAGRAYGRLQVIDVSNIEQPKSVAWYEPEYGGVHNVWVAGDTLYMGAYNAGFRAFDISGELMGDLRAQQREMVHVNTADMEGTVGGRNTAMTWGVVVRDGLAYVNDDNNGLWIIRMKPKQPPTVLVP